MAADVLVRRFDGRPLRLPASSVGGLLSKLADAGVSGGASYDGLVALEAAAHGHALLTLDRRAQDAYRRLGVAFQVIGD
jgi:hypothetical protein